MKKRIAVILTALSLLFTLATPARADFDNVVGVSNFMVPELNDLWNRVFQGNYRAPNELIIYTPYSPPYYQVPCTGSGGTTQGDYFGAFYCQVNEKVYFSYPFVQDWLDDCTDVYQGTTPPMPVCFDHDNDPNTTGDYAYGVALAHEWGHHIQKLQGWPYERRAAGQVAHFELHADCFAGIATKWLANKNLLSQDDLDEATYLFRNLGDKPDQPYWDQGAHGQPAMRVAWFHAGYNQYSMAVCNSVYSGGQSNFVKAHGGAAYGARGISINNILHNSASGGVGRS